MFTPPAVVYVDVPAAYPIAVVVKFNDSPEVENALSPDAVVAGVVPEVTTAPTIDKPVAGALLSILIVAALNELYVPAKAAHWYFVIEFSLLVALIGDDVYAVVESSMRFQFASAREVVAVAAPEPLPSVQV